MAYINNRNYLNLLGLCFSEFVIIEIKLKLYRVLGGLHGYFDSVERTEILFFGPLEKKNSKLIEKLLAGVSKGLKNNFNFCRRERKVIFGFLYRIKIPM